MKDIIASAAIASIVASFLSQASAAIIADSRADWPAAGTTSPHGVNGWTNGYYNTSLNGAPDIGGGDFIPFQTDGTTNASAGNHWNGTLFDWFAGNPPWTEVGFDATHPNSPNGNPVDPGNPATHEHVPTRRYQIQPGILGVVQVDWDVRKLNVNCGDGVTLQILHNGVMVDQGSIAANDGVGLIQSTNIAGVQPGDYIDMALFPGANDFCDGTAFGGTLTLIPEPSGTLLVATAALGLILRRRRI